MVIAPTITSRMEITMATMGRLMKNLDMCATFPSSPPQKALGSPACPDELSAHLRRQPVLGVHDGSLIAALQLRDRPLRHEQSTLLRSGRRPDFGIPSRAQKVSRVGKHPGDLDRARVRIHLAIREVNPPGVRMGYPVRQDEIERQLTPLG